MWYLKYWRLRAWREIPTIFNAYGWGVYCLLPAIFDLLTASPAFYLALSGVPDPDTKPF